MYNNERPHNSLGYKPPVAFLDERLQGYAFPIFIQNHQFNWNELVLNVSN
jgi:putative transposase